MWPGWEVIDAETRFNEVWMGVSETWSCFNVTREREIKDLLEGYRQVWKCVREAYEGDRNAWKEVLKAHIGL